MYSRNPSHMISNFMINDFEDSAGKFTASEEGVRIRMKLPEPVEEETPDVDLSEEEKKKLEIRKNFIVGKIFFYNADNEPVLIIICTLDPNKYLDYLYL